MNALGRHLLVELFECDATRLDDLDVVKQVLMEAAARMRATVVNVVFHRFNPVGISGVIVIAEAHLSIHTWPEHRYAAVDVFSCGETLLVEAAAEYVTDQLKAARTTVVDLHRGCGMKRRGAMLQDLPAPVTSSALV